METLAMKLFVAFEGRVRFWKMMMSFTKYMIKYEGPDQDLLLFIHHTDTLIL